MNYALLAHKKGYWISLAGQGNYSSAKNSGSDLPDGCTVRVLRSEPDNKTLLIVSSGDRLAISSHAYCNNASTCPCRKLAIDFCSYKSSDDDFETFLEHQSGRLVTMSNFDYLLFDGISFFSLCKKNSGLCTSKSFLHPGIYLRRLND